MWVDGGVQGPWTVTELGGRKAAVTVVEMGVGRARCANQPPVIRVPGENSSSLPRLTGIKLHTGQNSDTERKCLSLH